MSDTVKLIIEIPEETYEYWKTHRDEYVLAEAIGKGILLDIVKAKIKTFTIAEKSKYDRGVNEAVLKCFNALDNIG